MIGLTRALQQTADPLGSWTVQVIWQRLLQSTERFRRRVAQLGRYDTNQQYSLTLLVHLLRCRVCDLRRNHRIRYGGVAVSESLR